jgi:hypothetical protein
MKRLIGGQPLYTKNAFIFSNATVLFVGSFGKSISYQIRSEHGNIGVLKDYEIEEHFNLHSYDVGAFDPIVNSTLDGYSLSVDGMHAENIKSMVPSELYLFEGNISMGTFNVNHANWIRFSEILGL